MKREYCVAYISSANIEHRPHGGTGGGIHAICFDTLESTRYARVPVQVTPRGYAKKLSGAEQKDKEYDPEYSGLGLKVKAKEGTVVKDGTDITLVDGLISCGTVLATTAIVKTLLALLEYSECKNTLILTDDKYLHVGLNSGLKRWKANEWLKRDGTDINDRKLWEEVDALLEAREGLFEVEVTRGGKDTKLFEDGGPNTSPFGNTISDRNAALASVGSVNDVVGNKWILTSIHETGYWDPEKPIPTMLQQKWAYQMSDLNRPATLIDGEKYTHYFLGDHNKSKDDIELLGKMTSDGGFSLVLHKEEAPVIDLLTKLHVDKMWEHSCNMYKSSLMVMVNLASVLKPKGCWEVEHVPHEYMLMSGSRNDVSSGYTDDLYSKVIRPPKLSFRVIDLEEQYKEILYSYCLERGKKLDELKKFKPRNICVKDVTDYFYEDVVNSKGEVTGVKVDVFYSILSTSVTFNAPHPYNDKELKLIFTRGVDLPARSILTKLEKSNPRISVVTWQFDTIMIHYGIIVESDEGIGLWSGYSSTRILNAEEQ